jgi:hypothetical protein
MSYRIFLGSSKEMLRITEALASLLHHDFDPVPWTGDVFLPGSFTIESLLKEVSMADFAIFVFGPDDVTTLRKKMHHSVRDNVVFELGLFLSRLGRERCFFLMPKNLDDFRIPTDLIGINYLTDDFDRSEKEPKNDLTPAVGDLKAHVRRLIDGDGTTPSLSGRWIQNWKVVSDRFPPENPAEAEITQIGSRFEAISTVHGRTWVINGEIQRGNVVTGRRYDREKGATYFGAFQLIIEPMPDRMTGKWIGFSQDNRVKEGDWEWRRHS